MFLKHYTFSLNPKVYDSGLQADYLQAQITKFSKQAKLLEK